MAHPLIRIAGRHIAQRRPSHVPGAGFNRPATGGAIMRAAMPSQLKISQRKENTRVILKRCEFPDPTKVLSAGCGTGSAANSCRLASGEGPHINPGAHPAYLKIA